MYEIGHRIYWLDKVGWRLWQVKDGAGRVVCLGSRSECLDALRRLRFKAAGMGA